MHAVIFPTWRCQLACEYCSIRHSAIDRATPEAPWQEWARVLPAAVGPGALVDVAGGEPLLYPGIVDLLHALGQKRIGWALTTNGKAVEVVERLCAERPVGCVGVNVSDHAGNPEAVDSVRKLRQAGYAVHLHRVDHPAAGQRLQGAQVITYQAWVEGRATDGVARWCSAGQRHWVADPRGDLWRCVVALETGQPPAGNLFRRDVQPGERECRFGCTSCYTEDPASWQIEMRAL